MKVSMFTILILGVVVGGVVAQPKDGDLVITIPLSSSNPGWMGYLDPAKPTSITTLAKAPSSHIFSWVRMASNNVDLVVNEVSYYYPPATSPYLMQLTTTGVRNTVGYGHFSLPGVPQSFELDHDGQWIATGNNVYGSWNFQTISGTAGSIFLCKPTNWYEELSGLAIDRDPGCPAYCFVERDVYPISPPNGSNLFRVDRQGNVTWLARLPVDPISIQLHPRTGDYLASYYAGTGPAASYAVVTISKTGHITTIYSKNSGVATRVTQDDHLWLRGYAPDALYKFHIPSRTVVSTIPGFSGQGLEVYGYRRLVCTQWSHSPQTVTVDVQSRHSLAPGASYILACSPARRPGMKFPNGEWLDLDVGHPLFTTSVLGWTPSIFQNFSGTLDQNGNATAKVVLPPGLPKMNDMAIFVAGVIYQGQNIIQVTNTHWFVLP